MQKLANNRLDALLAFFTRAIEGVQKEDYQEVSHRWICASSRIVEYMTMLHCSTSVCFG